MATFVKEHDPADFAEIHAELLRKTLPTNYDRLQAGTGKSQAFGVIRRWSYRPWLSRCTWMRPELWAALQAFANIHVPIQWDAVQVNDSYISAPHTDKGNCGDSYIVAFGDFTGGALNVAGDAIDIRHRGFVFNGSQLKHWAEPWTGQRYSLVFFKIAWPAKFPQYTVTSRLTPEGTECSDSYDNSVIVLDRRGHVVRVIQQGEPKEWIGHVTYRGQPSRSMSAPAPPPNTQEPPGT